MCGVVLATGAHVVSPLNLERWDDGASDVGTFCRREPL